MAYRRKANDHLKKKQSILLGDHINHKKSLNYSIERKEADFEMDFDELTINGMKL
jgi:hypothetical protein